MQKGAALKELDHPEGAIETFDHVVERYGDAGEAIGVEVAVGGDTVFRFVTRYGAREAALHEQVATALFYKGSALGELDRREEAIEVYDEVVERYDVAGEPALRELVAMALVK